MNPEFIAILQKLISEQGKEVIATPGRFKAFIADYTHGEFKKESRLILHALEAGVQTAIDSAENMEICKKQQVKILSEENFWKDDIAASVFDTLLFILKGENIDKNCCKKCSKEIPKEWKACPYCGDVVSQENTVSNNTLKTTTLPKSSISTSKTSSSHFSFTPRINKWTCDNCGDSNLETSIMCYGCGSYKSSNAKITSGNSISQNSSVINTNYYNQSKIECYYCGKQFAIYIDEKDFVETKCKFCDRKITLKNVMFK